MSKTTNIYFIRSSSEEERPAIDYNLASNRSIDWLHIGDIMRGDRDVAEYSPPHVIVKDPNALQWDFFSSGGAGLGLFSQKAVELLKPFGSRFFDFFLAFINDFPYFFIKRINSLDCLNREKSVLEFFQSTPRRVMNIEKYVFKKELIEDPLLFCIPERIGAIFATQTVHQIILDNQLIGFTMQDAEIFGNFFPIEAAYQRIKKEMDKKGN